MDKFKALSLVLLGMVIGLGYAVACGSDDDTGAAGSMLPGVGVAMAQEACAQWDVRRFEAVGLESEIALEAGWAPFGSGTGTSVWAARCAQ